MTPSLTDDARVVIYDRKNVYDRVHLSDLSADGDVDGDDEESDGELVEDADGAINVPEYFFAENRFDLDRCYKTFYWRNLQIFVLS